MKTIFNRPPSDWKDLELLVCQLLNEAGLTAEQGVSVKTVRGAVDVDVLAFDKNSTPPLNILVECKNWANNVPKHVIHSFRTVMDDAGANVGYVISSSGFQKGAYEAAYASNISLMNWEEFQDHFYDRWFSSMKKSLEPLADQIFEYMDFYNGKILEALGDTGKRVDELNAIHKRYSIYMKACSYLNMIDNQIVFPLTASDPRQTPPDGSEITFDNARDFFDLMFAEAENALAAYEDFISKYTEAPIAPEASDGQ